MVVLDVRCRASCRVAVLSSTVQGMSNQAAPKNTTATHILRGTTADAPAEVYDVRPTDNPWNADGQLEANMREPWARATRCDNGEDVIAPAWAFRTRTPVTSPTNEEINLRLDAAEVIKCLARIAGERQHGTGHLGEYERIAGDAHAIRTIVERMAPIASALVANAEEERDEESARLGRVEEV